LEAARRQLDAEGNPCRKVIKIKTYSVVGFSLVVTDLSDEDSLKLQIFGLGGKHHMGCGIFTLFPRAWRFSNV
jgi:CRISPR-associated protein Cas6